MAVGFFFYGVLTCGWHFLGNCIIGMTGLSLSRKEFTICFVTFYSPWYRLNRCNTQTSRFFCFSNAGCGKLSWPGSSGLSMIGECRWVLRCFPYRYWVSSPPLKTAAAASPALPPHGHSFPRKSLVVRGDPRWGICAFLMVIIAVTVPFWHWRRS